MYDCQHLDHPFLHDTGVSQTDRNLKALLPENILIDGRKTADLLVYFTELAKQVNFYNPDLSIGDWTPFFDNSLPFLLSRMAAYPLDVQQQKMDSYAHMLHRNATPGGLQLLLFYGYYTMILPLQRWALLLQGTGLDLETSLNKLIKANLQQPLQAFIALANTASRCYGTRKIDLTGFLAIPAWGLDQADLYAYQGSFLCTAGGARTQLLALWEQLKALLPFFTGVITQASSGASKDVNDQLQQLLTLDGKQDLPPHLALLFSFLSLFKQLQSDLNAFSKKHLNYFYTKVLRLKPAPAVADKAFLVFTIQQQFSQYLLKKGLLVKDGKDSNKADILFGLDDQLVVNQAKITDTRTLFFHNLNRYDQYYTEGAYMAPNVLMADGVKKPFSDASTASWPTLGSSISKYIPTGDRKPIPYPGARLGFILHSPVLLLGGGTRNITITLACDYNSGICPVDPYAGQELGVADLLAPLQGILNKTWFYFTQDNLAAALGGGLDPALGDKIEKHLNIRVKDCYGHHKTPLYSASVDSGAFTSAEVQKLIVFFQPRQVFQFQFSGAKGWVIPEKTPTVALTAISATEFTLQFTIVLDVDLPAVTFYDKKVFGVDYQTTDPLVMILVDDTIKIPYKASKGPDCCLEQVAATNELLVSTYQFFKHLQIKEETTTKVQTAIVTNVCGLKNFIVQNDQNVMDVNSPVYPFGTRPTIIDFDIVIPGDPFAPAKPNLIGPNFYIGSAEIFCKSWNAVWIGINWQNKPVDFHEYYAGYVGSGTAVTGYGLDQAKFQLNLAALADGTWNQEGVSAYTTTNATTGDHNRLFFDVELIPGGAPIAACSETGYAYSFYITPDVFGLIPDFVPFPTGLTRYTPTMQNGFLRFTMENQDFLHKDYSYVLARQMIAFGKLPDNTVSGAVYYDPSTGYYVVDTSQLLQQYEDLSTLAGNIKTEADQIATDATGGPNTLIPKTKADDIRIELAGNAKYPPPLLPPPVGLVPNADALVNDVANGIATLKKHSNPSAVIPKEPWTPIIQNMVIHYSATATITDMGLIHLYPYDGTYENMDIDAQPGMLPLFCGEGYLFLGVQNLLPGENLNILFQLAEATADSEDAPDLVHWEYLSNNQWGALKPDQQVIADGTENLTRSGIVELSVPKNISSSNTVMPAGLYWLRAWVPSHTPGTSETLALFTQAMEATFVPTTANAATATAGSDLTRLGTSLAAGSLAKLNTADATVTGVQQPYPSFGGKAPESSGNPFFVRVSELLRHKGRGIQKWDYERLVLQGHPQVWRAKCINHSYFLNAHQYLYDFPMAPGNVMVAVIPDTRVLAAADSLQPRVPVSILEDIHTQLLGIISPFIQLFVVNPRYEPVDFCLKVVLEPGMDRDFYRSQLAIDLRQFLAPWTTGDMDRYEFGIPLYRSDVIQFIEGLDYIDYLLDLEMTHQGEPFPDPNNPPDSVEPLTPRSILIAGDITVDIPKKLPAPCSPALTDCENQPTPVVDHCKQVPTKATIVRKNGNDH